MTYPRAKRAVWLAIIAILGIGTWAWFHERSARAKASSANQRKTSAVPVSAAVAANGSIDVYFTGLGTVTPLATITVKTRIDGELMEVNYHEGDIIRQRAARANRSRPYRSSSNRLKLNSPRINQRQNARRPAAIRNAYREERGDAAGARHAAQHGPAGRGRDQTDQAAIDSAKLNSRTAGRRPR